MAAIDDARLAKQRVEAYQILRQLAVAPVELPPWLGRDDIHASHRGNLLRKHPNHYARHVWTEPPDLPYVWPIPGGKDPAFWGDEISPET